MKYLYAYLILLLSACTYGVENTHLELENEAKKYIDITKEFAKKVDLVKLNKINTEYLKSKFGKNLISARIWNYSIEKNHGLILNYRSENNSHSLIKVNVSPNKIHIITLDDRILIIYYQRQQNGELGPLNYKLEYKKTRKSQMHKLRIISERKKINQQKDRTIRST